MVRSLEEKREYQRQYREVNRESLKAKREKRYAEKREELLAKRREYNQQSHVQQKLKQYQLNYWAKKLAQQQGGQCNDKQKI